MRAALGDGVTKDEIREVLPHRAVHAGIPAANGALRVAEDVFAANA
jgi:alkylhydroperoxidase/carboxymuconolactone decarboxylase family protein YurZ